VEQFVTGARLRHIVLAADSLAPAVALARAGLGLEPGISDPAGMSGFDLEHEVLLLGSTYLEIVAPLGGGASSAAARFLARGGPGGYMLDLQVPDLDLVLERVAQLGLTPVLRDEYRGNQICQLHPRDFGTLLEVDQIAGSRDWHWDAEFPSSSRAVERALPVGAVLAVPSSPLAMAERWAFVFGGTLGPDSVRLSGCSVSFVPAGDGRPGLRSVDVVVPGSRGEVEIAGVAFRLFSDAGGPS
jgi:hypothetical protein